jgi:hypothetical protein
MKQGKLLGSLTVVIAVAPFAMQGSMIQGTTAGKTVTGVGIDDTDTATTMNITYQTFCPWIMAGAARFPTYNFVFAGQGVASNIPNIDPGDFTIDQYSPWVVSNNATTNNITPPDDSNVNRGVTDQDAGGANIVISYTPLNAGDPTKVNFVQAFIQNTNGAGFNNGTMDSGRANPYYNGDAVSGTGTTRRRRVVPLSTDSTTAAWMVDIPYRCENGLLPASAHCIGGKDDTLTSQVQKFQTFIESDKVIDGRTYNVLYGGVQWGYSFTNVDIPEPASIAMAGAAFALLGLLRFRRRTGLQAEAIAT